MCEITKKELEQIYYLNRELRMWQQKKEELEADIAPPVKQITGMPFSNTNETHSPTEEKAIALAECTKEIDAQIKRLRYAKRRAEKYIMSVDDTYIRQLLEYRCVCLYRWERIARLMGEGFTAESVRQTYHRYIAKMKG